MDCRSNNDTGSIDGLAAEPPPVIYVPAPRKRPRPLTRREQKIVSDTAFQTGYSGGTLKDAIRDVKKALRPYPKGNRQIVPLVRRMYAIGQQQATTDYQRRRTIDEAGGVLAIFLLEVAAATARERGRPFGAFAREACPGIVTCRNLWMAIRARYRIGQQRRLQYQHRRAG